MISSIDNTSGVATDSSINVYVKGPSKNRTFVAMSESTGLSISQVADEVLYEGLVEMQELPALKEVGWR